MEQSFKSIDQVRAALVDMAVRFGPKLATAIIILVIGHYVGRSIGRALDGVLSRLRIELPARQLLVRIARLLVVVLFGIVALENLGIQLLPLIAGLGVAGAGVALAMQGVLGNLAAGLTIIFTKPFRVGDYISISKEEGVVLDITLSSTTLGHADLSRVVIPNRKIVGEILHNYGRIRQLDLRVEVSGNADVDAALGIVGQILRTQASVLQDPAPAFGVASLAQSRVTLSVAPWVSVSDHGAAIGEINKALLDGFRAAGIEIAAPHIEVRIDDGRAHG